jgi:hypothetical protein
MPQFVSAKFEQLLHLPSSPRPNQFYLIIHDGHSQLYFSDRYATLYLLNATAYDDIQARNAIGTILTDSSTINFTYDAITPTISADVVGHSVDFTKLATINTSSLLGRGTAGTGNIEVLSIGNGLHISGGALSLINNITLDSSGLGFYGTASTPQPTVTGSRGSNAALASLLTALADLGLIVDSSVV